jgi:1-acyl-sn-glycerol-3-phosphate acyltransferase
VFERCDPDGLENRDEAWVRRFAEVAEPWLERWFHPEVRGIERIPEGPALYVGNHSGGSLTPDTYIFGCRVYRERGVGAVPYGLAHSVVWDLPVASQLFGRMGALRACPENAIRLLAAGRKVLVYPGGDMESMRPYGQRDRVVFAGRRGYVRIAIRTGVPILPLVSCGSHGVFMVLADGHQLSRGLSIARWTRIKVWPVVLSFPWGLTIAPPLVFLPVPVKVLVELLEPIRFERTGEDAARDEEYVVACDTQVRATMQACLTRLAAERRRRGYRL